MKYMLLIYNNPEALAAMTDAEIEPIYARVDALLSGAAVVG